MTAILSHQVTKGLGNQLSRPFLEILFRVEATVLKCTIKISSEKFIKIHMKKTVLQSRSGLQSATLFKKSLQHRCFDVKFAKFPE